MSMKITGLDKLQRELKELQAALQSLHGPIADLKFNPDDPDSIQEAINQMEQAVDEKAAAYSNNPLVSKVVNAVKAQFRQRILEKKNDDQA